MSRFGALTLLSVASLTIMVGCAIVPGLQSIATALGVGGAASWLVTLPALGVVVFGPLAGLLIERIGARRTLCISLFLYGVLGASGVMLHGAPLVFADRFLLGGATAMVMVSGTTLISEFYEGVARLRMLARQGMSIELGGVILLAVGGTLAGIGWQWPFALYLLAWVFLALVLVFVPESPVQPVAGRAGPGADATAKVSIADIWLGAAASMILFFVGIILLPVRLVGLGMSEAQTGYFLAGISLAAVVAASGLPTLTRAVGARPVLVASFAAYGAAHLVFAASTGVGLLVVGGLLQGLAFGLSVPLLNHMMVERSPAARRGRNLGYLSVALFLGQFLSSFVEVLAGAPERAFIAAAVLALISGAGFCTYFVTSGRGAALQG